MPVQVSGSSVMMQQSLPVQETTTCQDTSISESIEDELRGKQ